MMEGFTHHGSMFLIDKKLNLDLFIETVRQELLIKNSSISKINNDGLSIRIMGTKAEPLFQFFQMVASLYKKMVADGR
jgi:urease accessory protein UreH